MTVMIVRTVLIPLVISVTVINIPILTIYYTHIFEIGQKLETESEIKTDRAIGNPPGSSLPSTEDNSAPSSSTRHLGTYYVRSGGMAGIPNELWKRLSSLIDGVGEDEGKERNEGDHSLDASDGTAGVKNKIDPDLNQENDTEDEKDEDEEEEPVIVGIEECILLKDCIEKKLLLLRSTHQRYLSSGRYRCIHI
jgi:hypothetical protein